MKTIPTIFIGTSAEGTSSLEGLVEHPRFDVSAVITQTDKPSGRKKEPKPTPIKETAAELGLSIHTPSEKEDVYQHVLETYKPKLAIVIAFGQFLPKSFLDSLEFKCLNVHYSLLPLLRGAIPTQSAILQGHSKTGVTIQVMEETMDTGPIIAQTDIPIKQDETTPSLKGKLIPAGTKLLLDTLPGWVEGKITPQEQNHSKATYCYMKDISRDNAKIDWENMEPEFIERMVRALLPWPVAWTTLPNGKKLKIYESALEKIDTTQRPGDILTRNDQLYFATKHKGTVLYALSVQMEGKKQMPGSELMKGLHL